MLKSLIEGIENSSKLMEDDRDELYRVISNMHTSGVYDAIGKLTPRVIEIIKKQEPFVGGKIEKSAKAIKDIIEPAVEAMNIWFKDQSQYKRFQ